MWHPLRVAVRLWGLFQLVLFLFSNLDHHFHKFPDKKNTFQRSDSRFIIVIIIIIVNFSITYYQQNFSFHRFPSKNYIFAVLDEKAKNIQRHISMI